MRAPALDVLGGLAGDGPASPCIGIEQEFEVWRGDERIDFRDLIHDLPVPGLRLDPGDVNAYRLRTGLALTCDEAEAELASPPVPVAPGFAATVRQYAALSRHTLEGLLPPGFRVEGYSTHISVSLPGPPDAEFAERYARTFGPLFAALADRPHSLGIYVRPRPGRLELCSDFAEGARLEATAAFAAGTVMAGRLGWWPEDLSLDLLPCKERFGYRVHRRSSGFDLYANARGASLLTAGGASLSLQALFERAVEAVTAALTGLAAEADLAELQAVVAGARPFGVEVDQEMPDRECASPCDLGYGLAASAWAAAGAGIRPWRATWDYAMFEVRAAPASAARYLSVPSTALQTLAEGLDREPGAFVGAVFASPAGELASHEQTRTPGVFSVPPTDPAVLLPGEVPVAPGEHGQAKSGRAWPKSARIGKLIGLPPIVMRSPSPIPPIPLAPFPPAAPTQPASPVPLPPQPSVPPAPPPPVEVAPLPPGPPWGIIVAVGSAVVGLVAVVVVVASGVVGGSDPPPPAPTVVAMPSETQLPTSTPKPTETTQAGAATASPAATETPKPTETVQPTIAGAASTATPTAAPAATATPDGGIPSATATSTPSPTATATNRPTETPRPTNTPTPTATPTPFIIAEPVPTEAPTIAPTPCVPIPGANNCR